jgi:hypothetical protein
MAYSAFENDYKVAINNILKDIYRNTDYWGTGPAGNQGIIKPLSENDDPKWSNYNFLNTHWTARDKVVLPFLGNIPIDKDKKYTDSENNTKFFKLLWRNRNSLFGPKSPVKDRLIEAVNSTRKRGTERESSVKKALESVEGINKVNMVAEAGGTEDFKGIDLTLESTIIPSGTAQVKPFKGITTDKDYWYVDTDLRREYTTDYMIFGKQSGMEYHVAVFKNEPKTFKFLENGKLAVPKKLLLLLINYNVVSRRSVVKSYQQ